MASGIHRISYLSRGRGLWFSFSISLYLPLLYMAACIHACRNDRREDLDSQWFCLCRVQALKRIIFFFVSCHLIHLVEGCPVGSALLFAGERTLQCTSATGPFRGHELGSSVEAARCAWGGDRWPQERERWAGLLGFWRWDRETTKTRGIGLSHQPLYRP